jgi:hypothetical protein
MGGFATWRDLITPTTGRQPDERVVYQWKWVKADPENPNLPIDHNDRFKVKVF